MRAEDLVRTLPAVPGRDSAWRCVSPLEAAWSLATVGWRSLLGARWLLHLLRGAIGVMMMVTFVYALKACRCRPRTPSFFVAAAHHRDVGAVPRRTRRVCGAGLRSRSARSACWFAPCWRDGQLPLGSRCSSRRSGTVSHHQKAVLARSDSKPGDGDVAARASRAWRAGVLAWPGSGNRSATTICG